MSAPVVAANPEALLISTALLSNRENQLELKRAAPPDSFFRQYSDEWEYCKRFYEAHGQFPDPAAFFTTFPQFKIIKTKNPPSFYLKRLQDRENYNTVKQMMDKITKTLLKPGYDNVDTALQVIKDSVGDFSHVNATSDFEVNLNPSRAYEVYETNERDTSNILLPPYPLLTEHSIVPFYTPQDLVLYFSRTSIGKTWLMLWSTINALYQGKSALFFTPEMSIDRIMLRHDTLLFGLDYTKIMFRRMGAQEKLAWRAMSESHQYPAKLVICDTSDYYSSRMKGVDYLRSKIEEHQCDAVFIDSAHRFFGMQQGVSVVEQALQLGRGMKEIAKSTKTVVHGSLQANKDAEKKKNGGGLGAVAWGDVFAQEADYLGEYYGQRGENTRILDFVKTRDANVGKIATNFILSPEADLTELFVVDAVTCKEEQEIDLDEEEG